MEKILLVLDARQSQFSSLNFAASIATLAESELTGLFVDNLFGRKEEDPVTNSAYFNPVDEKETGSLVGTATDGAIAVFVRDCAVRNMKSSVIVCKGEPIQEVLRESRYADLLIVDPGTEFYGDVEQLPSHFVKEILANSVCPVLLSPAKTTDMDEVVFCYDGSISSIYAIKQFTYLLPAFKSRRLLLLEVQGAAADDTREEHLRMLEWLQVHYKNVSSESLSGDTKDELFTFLFRKEKKIVVMGAYGRSALSTFFRRSAADSLIRAIDLPLFITHFNR